MEMKRMYAKPSMKTVNMAPTNGFADLINISDSDTPGEGEIEEVLGLRDPFGGQSDAFTGFGF